MTLPHRSLTRLLAVFFLCFAASLPCQAVTAVFSSADHIPVTSDGYTASGTLQLSLGFAPPPGADLTVVKNTGLGFISGTFSNVANGANVNLSFGGFTHRYVAWYYGGEGNNDLVLLWKDLVPTGWGANASGQLGDKSQTLRRKPVWVDGLLPPVQTGVLVGKTVVQVSQGRSHTLALCSDGTVVSWGGNVSGQLGDGSYTARSIPVRVTGGALTGKTVIQVVAGATHSLALCSDGKVVAWGGNDKGQLGNDLLTNSSVPVAVIATGVLSGKTVVSVAAGNTHSMALTSEGKVVTWGSNDLRQLGDNSEVAFSKVPVLAAEIYYRQGMRVEADGLAVIAQGLFRGVAAPILKTAFVPVAMLAAKEVALPLIREAVNTAMDSALSPLIDKRLQQAADKANSDGKNLETANNLLGPLIEEYIVAWAIEHNYMPANAEDGRVTSDADRIAKLLQTVNVDTLKDGIFTALSEEALAEAGRVVPKVIDLFAGETVTVDELELIQRYINLQEVTDVAMKFLPGVDVTYPQVPYDTALKNKVVKAISAGGDHNVVLTTDNLLAAWGDNSSLQYGHKDNSIPLIQKIIKTVLDVSVGVNDRIPKAVHQLAGSALFEKTVQSIAAGGKHTLVLCTDGTLVGWGGNSEGQLGNGGVENVIYALAVETGSGSALNGKTIVAVDAGAAHSLALCSDGTVVSWGHNKNGELGITSTAASRTKPVVVTTVSPAVPNADDLYATTVRKSSIGAWNAGDARKISAGSTSSHSSLLLVPPAKVYAATQQEVSGFQYTLQGNVAYDGGTAILQRGMVWAKTSENADPRLDDPDNLYSSSTNPSALTTGVFSTQATGLSLNTWYSYTVYARNAAMPAGDVHDFGTVFTTPTTTFVPYETGITARDSIPLPPGVFLTSRLPDISDPTHAEVKTTEATLGGNITFNGRSNITRRGVVVAELPDPRPLKIGPDGTASRLEGNAQPLPMPLEIGEPGVRDYHFDPSGGVNPDIPFPGVFTIKATGLKRGTVYIYRAYAQNVNGVTYTDEYGVFSTQIPNLAVTWSANDFATGDIPATVTNTGSTITPGSVFTPTLTALPPAGQDLTIIRNAGTSLIQGTFANMLHGDIVPIWFNGRFYRYVADYRGGESGRDLVLHWLGSSAVSWGDDKLTLSDNASSSYGVPTPLPYGLENLGVLQGRTVIQIARGAHHTLALCSDGTVAAWGANESGQLGNPTNLGQAEPVRVPVEVWRMGGYGLAGKTVVSVVAGSQGSAALCLDGSVVGWGGSGAGEAWQPTVATGLPAGKTVVSLAMGASHWLVLCSDGTVYSAGDNSKGQRGVGTVAATSGITPVNVATGSALKDKIVTRIYAGANHNIALCSDGTAAVWGENDKGQLGDGTTTNRSVPVALATSGGSVVTGWSTRLVAVAAGLKHTIGLRVDGK
ncbi:MAG: hypothetical protein JNG86_20385, partial [Verrucomicrobiaceae bacterium]|nr:hypothetical protein [Verrucomicrobiaceae bacterium]